MVGTYTGEQFEPCSLTADGEDIDFTHDADTAVIRADIDLPGDGSIILDACD